jgi:hypothetical protein
MSPLSRHRLGTCALGLLLGVTLSLSAQAGVTLEQVTGKSPVSPEALAKTVAQQWVLASADGEGGSVQLWDAEIKFFGEGKVIIGSSSEQIFAAVVSGVCSVESGGTWVNGLAAGRIAFWGHDGRSKPQKGFYDALVLQESLAKAERTELADGLNGAVVSQRKKLAWGFLRTTKLNLASPLSPEVETLRRSYLNQPEVIDSRRTAPAAAKLPAEVAARFLKHLQAGTASEASHLISPRLFEVAATQGKLEEARTDFTKELLSQDWPKKADPASLKMDPDQPLMGEFTAGGETYVIHLEPFDAGVFVKSVIPAHL